MDKIWLEQYPEGIPAEIDPSQYASIIEVFEKTCAEHGNKPAFTNFGSTLSFDELQRRAQQFCSFLQHQLQLEKGARVALMLPNVLQYPICLFGTLMAGCTVVNVNPLYTSTELKHCAEDSGVDTIIILRQSLPVLEDANIPIKNILVTEVGDCLAFPKSTLFNLVLAFKKPVTTTLDIISFKKALKLGAKQKHKPVELQPKDLAFLQYTGGTTGRSKGAMLSHGNMVANLEQASAWICPFTKPGEIIITALPLYHIFSLLVNCLLYMKLGALNVLITDPRNMNSFVSILKNYSFTAITGVNTLFNGLIHHKDIHSVDFSKLRMTLGGGMAVQSFVADEWQKLTNCVLSQAYGLTETSPGVCVMPLNAEKFTGSIGLPLPSTDIKVVEGELWIKGPQVMQGYWNQPEETQEALTKDGWLKSGDMVNVDEQGYVFIVDRKKDMVIVSGFNVYPNEVENTISQLEGVVEVAVIGIPSEASGEAVKAFIVKKDETITKEEIQNHCRHHLAAYKVPKKIEFREELPKSNVGKILRRELREEN